MCLLAGSRLGDVVFMQQLVSALRRKRQGSSRGQRGFWEDLLHSSHGQLCTVEGAAESTRGGNCALTPVRQACLQRRPHSLAVLGECLCPAGGKGAPAAETGLG